MRVVVLALALALVAGTCHSLVPDFLSSKTYVYMYETQLFSGLPENGLARAGLKLRSKVHISAIAENTYMAKFVEPELYELLGIWPTDNFSKAPGLTAALKPQLTIPVTFEYTNGIVRNIFTRDDMSAMTQNIYRGVLNVLQLNIRDESVYELEEEGVQGLCKTIYTINEDVTADRIFLTKTRNLNQCQELAMKDVGLAFTEKCVRCRQDSENLRGNTAFSYVLKRVNMGYLILEASVEDLIEFSPFTHENGVTEMKTKQSLVFLETLTVPVVRATNHHSCGSLKYKFSTELLQTPIQLVNISEVETQIREILDYMIKNNRERVHEDAPRKFLELIQLLRAAQLDNIWDRIKHNDAYRQWLLDAIPATGTPAVLRFIQEKYQSGELSDAEAAQALIASVHMVTADEEVIRQFQNLTTDIKIMRHPVLLGYGTMVSKYCTANKDCPPDFVMPIHLRLKEALNLREFQNISLCLKVLGNAGHPASIKYITKALPIHGTRATSLPRRIHADAIMALRNIAKREPRKIQEMALQLYMNKALHPELRMLACIVLFETKPSVGLMTALASLVNKEENLQVASFTYSHMKSMTRCTAAFHASVSAACNVAVRFLSPKVNRHSFRFSKAIHMDIYNRPLMLGAAASAFYMNDVGTIMPRSIMAKTSAYVAGAAADVLEVGLRTEGLLEAFLKNLHLTDNVDRITKMKRVIDALSHLKTLPTSTPLASIYVKLFGQEVAFADIDKAFINQLIPTDLTGPTTDYYVRKLLSGVDLHSSKPLLATEMRRILPTAAGLPMEINLYTSAVTAGTVQVKAATTPVLQQEFRFAHLLKQEIHIETEIRPSVAVNTFAVMGVNMAMFQAAVVSRGKFSSIMPTKIAARFNLANGNIKIEALPVSVPEDVIALQVESFVLARAVTTAKTTPIMPAKLLQPTSAETGTSQSSEINMAYPEPNRSTKAAEVAKKYCSKFPQLRLQICLKVKSASISDIALYKLAGKHSMALSFKTIKPAAIERLELEFQLGPRAATKIIKEINLSEDEIAETQPVLKKLRKILTPGLRNSTASFFSSSSRSSEKKMSSSHLSSHIGSSSSGSSNSNSSSSSGKSSGSSSSSSGSSSGSSGSRSSLRSFRSQMSSRFSSASSLASLFSASSQSASRHTSQRHLYKNQMKHKKTTSTSEELSTSRSSFEGINRENKFLGKDKAPYLVVLARAVRTDRKAAGYQLAVYVDKPKTRIQIILATLATDSNWMMCADGVVLNPRKVAARIAVGPRCKDVETTVTAEVDDKLSAVQFKMTWRNVPSALKGMAKRVLNYIPASMVPGLVERHKLDSIKKLSLTVVATSNTLDFIFKMSTRVAYWLAVPLPSTLSLQEIRSLPPFNGVSDAIHHLFAKATAAECSFSRGALTTFNKRRYNIPTFVSCPQILAQDCTDELKFIVLLKRDEGEQYSVHVKMLRDDIDLYQKNHKVFVKVNEMEIPITSLPYSTDSFQIRQKNEGVSIYAPHFGLQEVYFDTKSQQVKLLDWMRGQSCGLCGQADGETRQEFRTPSGRLTQNAVSHAFSWVLPARSCRENTECRMRLESVQMEREMIVHGQESRCYSVEPVLRCLPGCFVVKTAPVDVGFHCVPTASNVNDFEVQRHSHEKSIDLTEATEAHVACSCTAKCA